MATDGDRYEIVEEVGRGASGVVYRAHDRVAGEVVAIKVLSPTLDDEAVERLRRELRAARRVTHPGAVRLHDLIVFDGRPALTMEYVDGETLEEILSHEPPFAPDRLVALVRDVATAVGPEPTLLARESLRCPVRLRARVATPPG